MIKSYTPQIVPVRAIQWKLNNVVDVIEFVGVGCLYWSNDGIHLNNELLHCNDYILMNDSGRVWSCSEEVFNILFKENDHE